MEHGNQTSAPSHCDGVRQTLRSPSRHAWIARTGSGGCARSRSREAKPLRYRPARSAAYRPNSGWQVATTRPTLVHINYQAIAHMLHQPLLHDDGGSVCCACTGIVVPTQPAKQAIPSIIHPCRFFIFQFSIDLKLVNEIDRRLRRPEVMLLDPFLLAAAIRAGILVRFQEQITHAHRGL